MEPISILVVVLAFGAGFLAGYRAGKGRKLTEEELKEIAEYVLTLLAIGYEASKDKDGEKPCEAC